MRQCISHTFRSTCNNHQKKYSSKNIFRILGAFRTTFQRTNIVNFDKLVFQKICLIIFKHDIGDVAKPISDLIQTNNNYHSYGTRSSQSLRTPIVKSEVIYQTFTLDL